MDADLEAVLRRARTRHGVVSLADLDRSGVSRSARRSAVARGWIELAAPGVYVVAGAPRTALQRYAVALAFHPGSAIAHEPSAALRRLPGFAHRTPVVLLEHGRNRRSPVAAVRSTLWLPPSHVTREQGLTVTTVARTIFDLAGVLPAQRVAEALDAAVARKLCTLRQVQQVHFALARPGRRGTVAMRELLEARSDDWIAPASVLESRARTLFAEHDVPVPRFEVQLGDEEWIGRVDCFWDDALLVVELDGRRFHGGASSRDRDRRRDNRLMAMGLRVLRFTWDDLVERPGEVVALVLSALAHR